MGKLVDLFPKLQRMIKRDTLRFFLGRMNKRWFLLAKFFDILFFPEENRAVAGYHYWVAPFRYVLLLKLHHNHKRVSPLYRAEALQVRQRRRPKQRLARGASGRSPGRANERWTLDFVHDRLANGCSLRLLTVHDDYTRECLWIEVDIPLSGQRVARVLDYLTELGARPDSLLTDNEPEFAGLALGRWTHERQVTHRFITPEKPAQNGYIKSFNGKLGDECLNETEFVTVAQASNLLEAFCEDYNHHRPHSSLGELTAAEFAAKIA